MLDDSRDVRIRDISLGGLAFAYHWRLAVGVRIEMRFPGLDEHVLLTGRVVRCRREPPQWMIGVAFEKEREVFRMRMVEQICHVEDYRQRMHREEGRTLSSEEAAAEWVERHAAHFPRCGL